MPNYAPHLTLLALAMISLSACRTANSNPACVCPPIKEYGKELQIKLAYEIRAAQPNAAFPDVLQDYAVLRAQLRECK